jgi:ubiquinone/menaquinone biosynthesis C-methylase UbiE
MAMTMSDVVRLSADTVAALKRIPGTSAVRQGALDITLEDQTTMYDPDYTARYYDAYGEQEWDRLEATLRGRVSFHVHRWYLEQYINDGEHVLDIGCGPGRFTIELVRLGATVTAADISPTQLELHRSKVAHAGCEHGVKSREILNVVDLSCFPTHYFDAVVCYGGPLSYVFDRIDDALGELLRVTKPGGYVLFSVMSLIGTMRQFLPGIVAHMEEFGIEAVDRVRRSGDLVGEVASAHQCRMYRWSELEAILQRHPCVIEVASSSNQLVLQNDETATRLMQDTARWQKFLQWEVELGREVGARDGGTHILVVLRRDE